MIILVDYPSPPTVVCLKIIINKTKQEFLFLGNKMNVQLRLKVSIPCSKPAF
jgi:hypothetical protein